MGGINSKKHARAPLRAPLSACIWISDACNLACKYCYAAPFSGGFMETSRMLSLFSELIDLGVFEFSIAGGEPMLHPGIFDVLEKLSESNAQVAVLTNGTTLSKENVNRLNQLFADNQKFLLQISIDSVDSVINDFTRGQTERVLSRIDNALDSELNIQLSTVLTQNNIDSAHKIIDVYYPRVKRFHFISIQRTKESLMHPELLTNDRMARKFWENLRDYKNNFGKDLVLPSYLLMEKSLGWDGESEFHHNATFDCASCSAGITHVEIRHDFEILGCDIAKDHSSLGNARDKSFQDVWHSKKAAKLRASKIPACYKVIEEVSDNITLDETSKSMLKAAQLINNTP